MAIQMTGLVSGLDTQSIIEDLVKANRAKVDTVAKKQTKLGWQQEAWKELNTKINNFYRNFAGTMRFTNAYNAYKATSSNEDAVSVTASNSSGIVGTQKVSVKQMAQSAIQTSGRVSTESGTDAKASTKMVDLGVTAGQEFKLTTGQERTIKQELKSQEVKDEFGNILYDENGDPLMEDVLVDALDANGKPIYEITGGTETIIKVDENMTISQFTKKLEEAGINASFDEAQQRFTFSSKSSGAESNFKLEQIGDDPSAVAAARNQELQDIASTKLSELPAAFAQVGIDLTDGSAVSNEINQNIDILKQAGQLTESEVNDAKNRIVELVGENATKVTIGSGTKAVEHTFAVDGNGHLTSDAEAAYYNSGKATVKTLSSFQKKYDSLSDEDKAKYSNDEDGYKKFIADDYKNIITTAAQSSIQTKSLDYANAAKMANVGVTPGKQGLDAIGMTDGVRADVAGQDAIIMLNGAEYTSSENTINVNGLSITAKEVTTSDVTVTTQKDTKVIYDKIKSFLKEYNALMKEMSQLYNADSAKGYEPLTDEEKASLSDREVDQWEEKVKGGMFRRDNTLSSVMSSMSSAMLFNYKDDNGNSYNLSLFGIKTSGYYASDSNERNIYNIDGDSENALTSGEEDKLLKAIESDPEGVTTFFSKLADNVYKELDKKMKATSLKSAYSIYNDKQMSKEYDEYTRKIADLEEKLAKEEDRYYKQFTAMEVALSKIQSSTNGLFG